MADKKFTKEEQEAFGELKKSLHRAIAKADPALRNILSDLSDDDAQADVPPDQVPHAAPESVLYKGPQAPKAPSLSANGPKVADAPKNAVPAGINQMAINAKGAAAPKPKMGLSMPKSEEKQDETNLNGMGKLKDFLNRRAAKSNPDLKQDAQLGEQVENAVAEHVAEVPAHSLDKANEFETGVHAVQSSQPGRSMAGKLAEMGKVKGDKVAMDTSKKIHAGNLDRLKAMPKPNLTKTEYTPREVAVEVLKKAESILKSKEMKWDESKVEENKEVDPGLKDERQVANQNDIDWEYQQQQINTSKKRLNKFLADRKAKKVKDQ